MILLAAVERLAEAIGAGERATARERVPEPHPHDAGGGLRVDARPVHLAGLQLHDAGDAFDRLIKRTAESHAVLPAKAEAFVAEIVAAAHRVERERYKVQVGRA